MKLAVPAINFDPFHLSDLPQRLTRGNGRLACGDVKDAPPLGFKVPGSDGYTYIASDGNILVASGTSDAETVVELDLNAWRELVCEYRTPIGLVYAEKLAFSRGDYSGLSRWEAALWAMFMGRPVYDPASVDLSGVDGKPLDLRRKFAVDDPIEELRNYFRKTGYLLVKGVFSRDEINM